MGTCFVTQKDSDVGIIPRAAQQIFSETEQMRTCAQANNTSLVFEVGARFIEVRI
jgi:hypothetical protein